MDNTEDLKYAFCEDWFIFARDKAGNLYSVSTETWPEWLDVDRKELYKLDSVEKYMLPVAKKHWSALNWKLVQLSLKSFCTMFKDIMDPVRGKSLFMDYSYRERVLFIKQLNDANLYVRALLDVDKGLIPTMIFSYPIDEEESKSE